MIKFPKNIVALLPQFNDALEYIINVHIHYIEVEINIFENII